MTSFWLVFKPFKFFVWHNFFLFLILILFSFFAKIIFLLPKTQGHHVLVSSKDYCITYIFFLFVKEQFLTGNNFLLIYKPYIFYLFCQSFWVIYTYFLHFFGNRKSIRVRDKLYTLTNNIGLFLIDKVANVIYRMRGTSSRIEILTFGNFFLM